MAARPLSVRAALALVAVWAGAEAVLARAVPRPPTPAAALWWTGGIRAVELGLLAALGSRLGLGSDRLGLGGPAARRGLRTGLVVAAALGAAAFGAEGLSRLLAGHGWLAGLAGGRVPPAHLTALLVVGAAVAPAFEELLFRGVLYGALRGRWGPWPGALGSTLVFAAAHLGLAGVPWTQAAGGLVFCWAYERSGSLWAPYLVHGLGNACLFLLPWVVG